MENKLKITPFSDKASTLFNGYHVKYYNVNDPVAKNTLISGKILLHSHYSMTKLPLLKIIKYEIGHFLAALR